MARTKSDVVNEGIRPITFVQTGRVRDLAYETGMTVAQALRELNITIGRGQELRLNNSPISDNDTTLNPGDQLMLIGAVSGGQ